MVSMRYELVSFFDKYQIDVVFSGHDHCYSRSEFLLNTTKDESTMLTEAQFRTYQFKNQTIDSIYSDYLKAIGDEQAIVYNPDQDGVYYHLQEVVYYTLSSASGSKYYELVEEPQAYIAKRWQEYVPTCMIVEVKPNEITLQTCLTDTLTLIDDVITIQK